MAVAAYLIPQVMAYSGLVGVPAVVGLWGAVAAMLAYVVLGSSRVLSVGPESTVALMAGSVVAPLSGGDPARAVALSAALALVVGGWLALAWLARLGVVADLLSYPLLVGYLSGGAVLMVVGQLSRATGVPVSGDSIVAEVGSFLANVSQANLVTVALCSATMAVLIVVRRWRAAAPAPLIAVTLATAASALFDLGSRGVAVLGQVPSGLPVPHLPTVGMSDVRTLLVAGLGVAVVAYGDNMLIGRAFAKRGEAFDANQELLALSGVHAAVGMFSAFPVSSSGTRTALAVTGRARTQMYSLVAATVVVGVLMFAGPLMAALPEASLAAVVIYAAGHLVQVSSYRELWAFRRTEFFLALSTLAGTIVFGILAGVGIAVALSLVEMVTRLARPHDAIQGLVPDMAGMHDVDDYPEASTIPGLVVYRYDAPLFFANAEDFRRQATAAVDDYDKPEDGVRWLVLNMEANMHVDITAAKALVALARDMSDRGIRLGLARVKHDLMLQIERTDLLHVVGEEMVFATLPTAVAGYRASQTEGQLPFGTHP